MTRTYVITSAAAGRRPGDGTATATDSRELDGAARLARLETALAQLEALREREQRALAKTLHDDLGSVLTALGMRLAVLFRRVPAGAGLDAESTEIKALLADVTKTVHRLQAAVRPASLDHFGLEAAVEGMLDEYRRAHSIPCRVVRQATSERLSAGGHEALFAQLQDSLGLLSQLSGTESVEVVLCEERGGPALELALRGRDFPSPQLAAHLPFLTAIEERGRRSGVRVTVNAGTRGEIRLHFGLAARA